MHACESVTGYVTNDYNNKISFLSSRFSLDPNVSSLLKQAAIRSLSCEIVPGKEGQIYFGDTVCGHILSNTFFLKDAHARGFHRWYSIVVYMKDKHLLLNSWPFFEKHINRMVKQLQGKASQVYSAEQNVCSQRMLRLSRLDPKVSPARSLIKLTDSPSVFAQLHLWFTWLLCVGAKRLEESSLIQTVNDDSLKTFGEISDGENHLTFLNEEEHIWHLRKLRNIFGCYNFQKIIYSTLIGHQIILRGPKVFVQIFSKLLQLFLPRDKFRCLLYSDTYKTPDICNILGLDLCTAVPKSSEKLLRIDIVQVQEPSDTNAKNVHETYDSYNFIIKSESKLPEKIPTLLFKIDKCISDSRLSNRVVWSYLCSVMEQWFHTINIVKKVRKKQNELQFESLLQYLGVQDRDHQLIAFCTSDN